VGLRSALPIALLLISACGTPASGPTGDLEISVKGTGNGYLNIETAPDANCVASAQTTGDQRPLQDVPAKADSSGRASWSYTAITTDREIDITYTIKCQTAQLRGEVTTSPAPIRPNASSRASGNAPDIAVVASTYGTLEVNATPGSSCTARVKANAVFGELPPANLDKIVVGADRVARWTYSAPRVPAGKGEHFIACDTASGQRTLTTSFDLPRRDIKATAFTVHVTTAAPPRDNTREDPSLIPLRDSSVKTLIATLSKEWKAATRGLGSVQVTESSADMTIFVFAGRGTSVNRTSGSDGSEDVVIFVSDQGPRSVENNVAVALHELGHIWCCNGPGTTDGHWSTPEVSPGMTGVDKYGLMNHPVQCLVFSNIISCPNRFSDRELRTMGFTDLPPAVADPCVAQKRNLLGQLGDAKAQLTTLQAAIDDANARLTSLRDQITAIERQYPNGIPQNQYPQYQALVQQYNTGVLENRTRINTYNTTVTQANALVGQINALLCDSS